MKIVAENAGVCNSEATNKMETPARLLFFAVLCVRRVLCVGVRRALCSLLGVSRLPTH